MDGAYTKYKNNKRGSTTVGKTVGKRGRPRKDEENSETWEYLENPDGSTVTAGEYAIARGWACDFLDICQAFKVALPDSWKHCDVRIKSLFYTGLRKLLTATQLSQNNAKGRILMNSVYYDYVVRPRLKAAKRGRKAHGGTMKLEEARYTIDEVPDDTESILPSHALDPLESTDVRAATTQRKSLTLKYCDATRTDTAHLDAAANDDDDDDDDDDNALDEDDDNDDDDHDEMVQDDNQNGEAGDGSSADSGDEDTPLRGTKVAKRKRANATPSSIASKRQRVHAPALPSLTVAPSSTRMASPARGSLTTATLSPTLASSTPALSSTPSSSRLSAAAKGKQRALGNAVSRLLF